MSFLETYENILLTLIAISTTGLFIIRFLEWNTRPRDMSAEQVATLLRKFIEDTATQGEWDYFATGPRLAENLRRSGWKLESSLDRASSPKRQNACKSY